MYITLQHNKKINLKNTRLHLKLRSTGIVLGEKKKATTTKVAWKTQIITPKFGSENATISSRSTIFSFFNFQFQQ